MTKIDKTKHAIKGRKRKEEKIQTSTKGKLSKDNGTELECE
jgi:hypothetical protein